METATKPVRGRSMDAALTERILTETLEQLTRDGYAKLRIERIAAAVGCGKSTIYRRWPDKGLLVAETLASHLSAPEDVNTGDVVEDLARFAHQQSGRLNDEKGARSGVWSAMFEDDVRSHLWQLNFSRRREVGRAIITRGIDSGQIREDTDPDMLLDAISGFAIYRQAFRNLSIDLEHERRIVARLCGL